MIQEPAREPVLSLPKPPPEIPSTWRLQTALTEVLRLRAWLMWISPRDPDAQKALDGAAAPMTGD